MAAVRKGLFFILPLGATTQTTIDDPWVLAARACAPCYIGGWSAAEHWGLTEQIFRSTFVVTAGATRKASVTLLRSEFRTARAPEERLDSVVPVWRGTVRVAVSDRERTLADGPARPAWVGGVRHLAEMLATYRRSENWNRARLLAALANKSAGVIRLDPGGKPTGRIVKRWGLRINVTITPQDAS